MDDKPKCRLCELVSGIFGVLLGTIVLFISLDVLTNGSLSTLISGGTPEVENDES